MSKNYNQLSSVQRYQFEALIKAGSIQKEIAGIVGVHPSTICRELKRNIPKRGRGALEYRAVNAQRRTALRHDLKPKAVSFSEEMRQYAVSKLKNERYSPELIEVVGRKELGAFISRETLYKWIWRCKKSNHRKDKDYKKLYEYLAHGRRRRKRGLRHDSRGVISGRVSIERRPDIVLERKRFGDIEVDLMMGKDHKGSLLVMTDRATLLTKLSLLNGKEAKSVSKAIKRKLGSIKKMVKTLTFDNDKAFSKHREIGVALEAKTFFTRPYTSQDKGTVENRIGLIRRFLPKRTDLRSVTHQFIKQIEKLINNRPVRKFNYKTPNQVFSNKIALIS